MALNPVDVLPTRYWAVQYDGTNGSEIVEWIGGWILSEGGGVMSILVGAEQIQVNGDDWVIGSPYMPARIINIVPDSEFASSWTVLP